MSIVNRIRTEIAAGTTIPKPKATKPFKVKGWGRRRGEPALVYQIPSHTNPDKPGEKGVAESEFTAAYAELVRAGELTRKWFDKHLKACNKEGSCSFTTIGGVFELLKVAKYARTGVYTRNVEE